MEFRYDYANISGDAIHAIGGNLINYLAKLDQITQSQEYTEYESSINLPFDESILKDAYKTMEETVTKQLKYVIVVGIGGSNLGTKAVYDAIKGFYDVLQPEQFPKMIFVDTTNPDFLAEIQDFLATQIESPDEVIINVISKSGGTTETIANMHLVLAVDPELINRVVITTDEGSALWEFAKEKGVIALSIPQKVGGRYSVFSNVGIFPLLCAQINIVKLLEGAMKSRQRCLTKTMENNPAAVSAMVLFKNYWEGKTINDNFFFSPQLESLGKWYRQLLAESIGKEKDLQGDIVKIGITPTVSLGSADLHSQEQLYLGGPKNKTFSFVWVENYAENPVVSTKELGTIIPELENKNAFQIMHAIYKGTIGANVKEQIPFTEIYLSALDEENIGAYMQFKMIEIMFLGKLLNVNAFDQPSVEKYKTITKKLLQEK